MIGSIVIGVWVLLGLLNILLWREEVDHEADKTSVVTPEFFKKFSYLMMLIFSPYYFFHGVVRQIKLYLALLALKKVMYKIWREKGLNPRQEWKTFWKEAKQRKDKNETE